MGSVAAMSDALDDFNPCMQCGICCTHFRISFYWAEADDAPAGFVPAALTEQLTPQLACMKGSNSVPRRCVALDGVVGEGVRCTIYADRPTPCREFPVYFADGTPNPKCDELRATIGLPPLPLRPLPQAA
jgi:Fe-S-cluster containining protein